MLGEFIPPKSVLLAAVMGFGAVYLARQIGPIEKILDGTKVNARPNSLPLPDLGKAADGFPLVYAVAPAVAAIAIHKFL